MKLSSAKERKAQTIEKLEQITKLNLFDEIHLVDATGFEFEIDEVSTLGIKVVTHSFFQDKVLVEKYGYGYGEALIYERFSKIYNGLDCSVYKISGRYSIANLSDIVLMSKGYDNLFYTFYPRFLQYRKYVHTAFFKIKFADLVSCSLYCRNYLENYPSRPLEEAMFYWQLSAYGSRKSWMKFPSPQYVGISGLKNTSIGKYYFPYSFFRKLDFLPLMSFRY